MKIEKQIEDDPALSSDFLLKSAAQVRKDKGPCRLTTALCAHPNIAPAVLQNLLARNPEAAIPGLIKNPVLPLLALESPGFWEELGKDVVRGLLRRQDLPTVAARALSASPQPWLALEARTHIALEGELSPESYGEALAWLEDRIAEILALEKDQELRNSLFDLVEEGMAPEWAASGEDPENASDFQGGLAQIADTSVAKWLREGRDARKAMERWTEEHPAVNRRFARLHLARHPDTKLEVLQELQKYEDASIHRAIRRHPHTDNRLRVANHENIVKGLGRLVNSPYCYFAAPNLTPTRLPTFKGLLSSGGFLQRFALTRRFLRYARTELDAKILRDLINDANRYVRAVARDPEIAL